MRSYIRIIYHRLKNVVAAGADVDNISLRRLRGKCVDDVKNPSAQSTSMTSCAFSAGSKQAITDADIHPRLAESLRQFDNFKGE